MSDLKRNLMRSRWLSVADLMKAKGYDALLLTAPADIRWLTGFTGTNGSVLAITGGPPLLATDPRYGQQASQECPEVELIVTRNLTDQLLLRLREKGAGSLGVDPTTLTLAEFRAISAHPGMFGMSIQEVDSPLARLRMRKDIHELEAMRQAGAIAAESLGQLLTEIKVGHTEIHIARTLEAIMGDFGSADRAFESIVASGRNGGQPHHTPSDHEIQAGELLTIDFGAVVEGYRSDCTRTVVVGADPEDWQVEIYSAVQQAAEAARGIAAPGVRTRDVDAAARTVIADAEFAEFFVHGVGHGIGLSIHEPPLLGSSTKR